MNLPLYHYKFAAQFYNPILIKKPAVKTLSSNFKIERARLKSREALLQLTNAFSIFLIQMLFTVPVSECLPSL